MKNPTPIIEFGLIETNITNYYFSFIVILSADDVKERELLTDSFTHFTLANFVVDILMRLAPAIALSIRAAVPKIINCTKSGLLFRHSIHYIFITVICLYSSILHRRVLNWIGLYLHNQAFHKTALNNLGMLV